MHRILGDLWSISNPYYHAILWRGEGRGVKEEEGDEEGKGAPYTTQHSPSSGSLPRPCLASLKGRRDPREDSQPCRVKLHLWRLQQREEGAGMLAGGGEGLVLTFLLKLFTGGTGALSEHHSSYLHSSMFISSFMLYFPQILWGPYAAFAQKG